MFLVNLTKLVVKINRKKNNILNIFIKHFILLQLLVIMFSRNVCKFFNSFLRCHMLFNVVNNTYQTVYLPFTFHIVFNFLECH